MHCPLPRVRTGQKVPVWGERDQSVSAEWLPQSATETWRARQVDASIEGHYHTYYLSPLPAPDLSRIIGHDGRLYDVKGVTEIGRKRGLLIAVAAHGTSV